MDNRPIGIFDSGVGGLSAARVMALEAPEESFVYFGDTARVPYGDRTAEDIRALSLQDARFLRSKNVKALVIACNTITANALSALEEANPDIPVIGVIEPAAEEAVHVTVSGRIGVIATNATVRSGVYEKAVAVRLPDAQVTVQGCPALVPLIESGHTDPQDEQLMPVLKTYLSALQNAGVDTVILGCTHYPLIAAAVRAVMGEQVALVDSGAACVVAARKVLAAHSALAGADSSGGEQYYCSARKSDFVAVAKEFLGRSIEPVTQVVSIGAF